VKKVFAGIRASIRNAVRGRRSLSRTLRPVVLEAIEPRLLYSADLSPVGLPNEVAPAVNIQAQQQPIAATAVSIEIVVIDARVADAQILLADIELQRAAGRSLEVIHVQAQDDGLNLVTDAIAQAQSNGFQVSALHIISHGRDGEFDLGRQAIDQSSLRQNAAQFAAWSNAFTEQADLLIYGCNFAASGVGQAFAKNLAALTGADVAGNVDSTGAPSLGGDWTLNFTTGAIESALAVSARTQSTWGNLLGVSFSSDPQNVSDTSGTGNGNASITGAKTNTASSSAGRTVATDSTGNYAVAWVDQTGLGSIKLALFNENGTPKLDLSSQPLPVFTVSSNNIDAQSQPSIAMSSSGELIVVWNENGAIKGQRYSSAGALVGGNFSISNTTETCTQPSVAINDLNQFVVAWSRDSGTPAGVQILHDIWGESFNWNLTNVMPEQRLNSPVGFEQTRPSVAVYENRFVVVFEGLDNLTPQSIGVKARTFNLDGSNPSAEIIVNTALNYVESAPDVAMSSDRIVITWQITGTALDTATRYRVFDQNLDQVLGDQAVGQVTANDQLLPKVSISPSGDFIIVQQSVGQTPDGQGFGVFGRIFNRDGIAQAAEVSLSFVDSTKPAFVTGDQYAANIAWRGRQAISVWTSDTDNGAGGTIPQVFSRRATAIGPTVNGSLIVAAPTGAAAYIKEGQTGGTFYAHLDSQPTANVVFNVSTSDPSQGTIATGQTLTFTPTNWMTDQVVTVAATADNVVDVDTLFSIVFSPASTNPAGFNTAALQRTFSLINQNADELHEITVTTASEIVDGDVSSLTALYLTPGADGAVSLMEALFAAGNTTNLGSGTLPIDKINFGISSAPSAVIVISSANLPIIYDAVFIDGGSQFQFNGGRIVLEGQGGTAPGLILAQSASIQTADSGSSGSKISKLTLRAFANSGIAVYTTNNHFDNLILTANLGAGIDFRDDGRQTLLQNTIENSYVTGNAGAGVLVNGAFNVKISNNLITGNSGQGILITSLDGVGAIAAHRTRVEGNTIGGNGASGVEISGNGAQENFVHGNTIGFDSLGSAMGNGVDGILLRDGATDNEIGGIGGPKSNTIANNVGVGVRVLSGRPGTNDSINNRILGNSIYNNGSLGIDLTAYDVTNSKYPAAAVDTNTVNGLQNVPVLHWASSDGSSTKISGKLEAAPNSYYLIEFYSVASEDPSGAGEGATYLGYVDVSTDAFGFAEYIYTSAVAAPFHGFVSATATRASNSNYLVYYGTSEFAASELVKTSMISAENKQISVMLHSEVNDQSATGLTYSLLGSDSAHFAINPTTGELTFIDMPNFETMAAEPNSGNDQSWWAEVLVTNGTYSQIFFYVVDVADANDTPTLTNPIAVTTSANTTVSFNGPNSISINDEDVSTTTGLTNVTVIIDAIDGSGQPTGSFTLSGLNVTASNLNGTQTLTGKLSDVNASLQTLQFTPSSNPTQPVTITIRVNDQGSGFGLPAAQATQTSIAVNFPVTNSPPVLTMPATAVNVAFGGFGLIGNPATPTLLLNDTDSGTTELVLTVSTLNGALSLPPASISAITAGAYTGDSSFTLHGTAAALQQLMNQFIYTAGAGFSGSASIDFSVNDQQGGIDSKSLAILVNANSAPVIANVTSNLIYVENQGFSPLFASATLSDANHANLTIARVTIVSGFTSASDVFVFNPFPQVIETAGVPGERIFSGVASIAQYQSWLRGISYFNGSDNPTSTGGVLRVEFYDGFTWSTPAEITVQVVAQNDAPILNFGAILDRNVAFNSSISLGNPSNPNLLLSDIDAGASLLSLDIAASNGLLSLPSFAASSVIAGNPIGSTGLTLQGTIATLQLALNELIYTSELGFSGDTQILFVLNDLGNTGAGGFLNDTKVISIHVASNGAPLLSGVDLNAIYVENASGINLFPNLSISDVNDTLLQEARITPVSGFITSQDLLGFTSTLPTGVTMVPPDANGMIQILGAATLFEYTTLLRAFTFVNTSEAASATPRVVQVEVFDGTSWSLPVTTAIAIQAVDDLPTLTLPTNLSVAYGGFINLVGAGAPLVISDVDAGSAIYELEISAASGLIKLDAGTGITLVAGNIAGAQALRLQGTVAQFNAALANHIFYVAPAGFSGTTTVYANVFATNASPVAVGGAISTAFSSIGVQAGNPPVLINSTAGVTFIENSQAINLAPSLGIAGGNTGTLQEARVRITGFYEPGLDSLVLTGISPSITPAWNASSGELTLSGIGSLAEYTAILQLVGFRSSSDNPNTSPRGVEFSVFDGLQWSNVVKTNITIEAVNDSPTLSVLARFNSSEDAPIALSAMGLTVADVDSSSLVLTMQISSGTLTWVGSEAMPSNVQLLSGNSVQFSGTTAQIDTWAANFSLTPSANFNGEVNVQWSVTDVGANPLSSSGASTLVITPVNDSPLWQGTLSLNVDQGRQFLFSRSISQASDVEDVTGQLVYELVGLPSHGQLLLNGRVLNSASSFTQADIDQGLVIYQNDNQGTVIDNFSFKVADSGGAKTAVQTIDLKVQSTPVLIVTPTSGSGTSTTQPSGAGGPDASPNSTSATTSTGSTNSPTGSSESIAAGGSTTTPTGIVANTSTPTQRAVPRSIANANDSASNNPANAVNAETSGRASTAQREINQSSQDSTVTTSNALSAQSSSFVGNKFDGLSFMRIKTTAELTEYSDIARATMRDKGFAEDVQKVRDDMKQSLKLDRNVVASTTVVSASLSIGYVIWLVRGGALLSSLMASLPAWRMVDPLPILANMGNGEDQSDDDSLDAMIDKYKAKRMANAIPAPSPNLPSALEHSGS
jgi:hypothetical protein